MLALKNYGNNSSSDSESNSDESTETMSTEEVEPINTNTKPSIKTDADDGADHLKPIVNSEYSIAKSLSIIAAPDIVPLVNII